MSYQPIENHGVIGDLHTVALVGMDGAIDFMCLPEFDSPSVFAALLDHRRGGRFQLAPLVDGARQKQLYLPDTCVLLTRFLAGTGIAEVSDFMPVEDMGHQHDVVRRAKTVRGEVRFRMLCQPRFDYARASHTAERTPDGVRFVSSASATGTIATPGSATPPSRSMASCASASPRRPPPSCAGWRRAARSSSPTAPSGSCTGSTVATGSPRRRCRTSRATCARHPCASATPPSRSSSSTSTAS